MNFSTMSWSHAAALMLLACIAVGAAIAFRPRKVNRLVREPASPPWPQVDYSERRAKAVEWLGADYLLSQPINRIPSLGRRQAD